MLKSVIFVKKKNIWKKYLRDKNYRKVSDHCNYTEKYRGAVHSIYNLKYSASQNSYSFSWWVKVWLLFHHKRVTRRIKKKQFACFGQNTRKHVIFTISIEKEVTRIDKNGEKPTKKYILHIAIYWWCKIYGKLMIKSC